MNESVNVFFKNLLDAEKTATAWQTDLEEDSEPYIGLKILLAIALSEGLSGKVLQELVGPVNFESLSKHLRDERILKDFRLDYTFDTDELAAEVLIAAVRKLPVEQQFPLVDRLAQKFPDRFLQMLKIIWQEMSDSVNFKYFLDEVSKGLENLEDVITPRLVVVEYFYAILPGLGFSTALGSPFEAISQMRVTGLMSILCNTEIQMPEEALSVIDGLFLCQMPKGGLGVIIRECWEHSKPLDAERLIWVQLIDLALGTGRIARSIPEAMLPNALSLTGTVTENIDYVDKLLTCLNSKHPVYRLFGAFNYCFDLIYQRSGEALAREHTVIVDALCLLSASDHLPDRNSGVLALSYTVRFSNFFTKTLSDRIVVSLEQLLLKDGLTEELICLIIKTLGLIYQVPANFREVFYWLTKNDKYPCTNEIEQNISTQEFQEFCESTIRHYRESRVGRVAAQALLRSGR